MKQVVSEDVLKQWNKWWVKMWQAYTCILDSRSLVARSLSAKRSLFSCCRARMVFLAMARSSFIKAFVACTCSSFCCRLATVALQSTSQHSYSHSSVNDGDDDGYYSYCTSVYDPSLPKHSHCLCCIFSTLWNTKFFFFLFFFFLFLKSVVMVMVLVIRIWEYNVTNDMTA